MEELQNCIADAQYSEALRDRVSVKPLKPFMKPPAEGFSSVVVDVEVGLTSQNEEPLAWYYLQLHLKANDREAEADFLTALADMQRQPPSLQATLALAESFVLSGALPKRYRRACRRLADRLHLSGDAGSGSGASSSPRTTSVVESAATAGSFVVTEEGGKVDDSVEDDDGDGITLSATKPPAASSVEEGGVDSEVRALLEEGKDAFSEVRSAAALFCCAALLCCAATSPAVSRLCITLPALAIALALALAIALAIARSTQPAAAALLPQLVSAIDSALAPLISSFRESPLYGKLLEMKWVARQAVGIDDFTMYRDLGRGAYGAVAGGLMNYTGQMFAMKCMNRRLIKGKKALRLVRTERDILAMLGDVPSPFVISLRYAFLDKDYLYFILPLMSGGDLKYHLRLSARFDEERARFYAAEIGLGLAHLHRLGLLYRDLKPENILLAESGHLRLSDLGLAIKTDGRPTKGRAGTPGYWPPEMILRKPYNFAADWWGYGVVIYEMLVGRCPFSSDYTKRKSRDEATLEHEVTYPREFITEEAQSLLEALLVRDPAARLGSGEGDFDDIRCHPWFASIDWEAMQRLDVEPPWVPKAIAINAEDISDIEERNHEHEYRKLKLTEEDDLASFAYNCQPAHERDIVEVLTLEADGTLEYLDGGASAGCECCTIC
eukprot:PLAT8172.2.p1 GENE.PLAT8172.2~~PLAT8172.2.p1  ORF type:complete len:668 (-),score=244.81 PLAT8172.2:258-2261(-)